MRSQNLFFALAAFGCLFAVVLSQSNCNRCMTNNVACVNQTHFKYCMDSTPVDNGILYCGAGNVCTDLAIICVDESIASPVCTDEDVDCRSCDGSSLFVCTSQTTFQMCNGTALTGDALTCPTDTYCSIDSGEFCVKECKLPNGKFECNQVAA
ncbi:uncharacterized protein LOC133845049 [Drosophila sulfurigaster albostrigata]|uniref:uncharacterized protein LOC133845049 n=1 Tax=Drosophila sulfurigaster albostrigata TaxID=89887 RepID=UPI002D21AF10|nr:uncharacterized protein LOC133845049 [Drosophila sulfurigaster albostrigata]